MGKDKIKIKFIFIFLILLFCLLCILVTLLIFAIVDGNQESSNIVSITSQPQLPIVQEIIEKYECTYIKEENNTIYLTFSKDLYNENGTSNEEFFKNLIDELTKFFERENFILIDEDKNININVVYDDINNKYNIIINDIENFFEKTDGNNYINVENTQIAKYTNLYENNKYLRKLNIYDDFFSSIEEDLGEGIDLKNGYVSYLDDSIRIRTVPTGAVKNMIFTDKYDGDITSTINTDMNLKQIAEIEPTYNFGSVKEGYLGYRNDSYYYFFYDDEISIYTYSYKNNSTFEDILEEYIETGDLDIFSKRLKNRWQAYDLFEYDEEKATLHVLYSTRGVEINIKENDFKGITFYQNYYFTDYSKSLVKNGIVSFNNNVDLVHKIEMDRREKIVK